jgi:hypothetical protein
MNLSPATSVGEKLLIVLVHFVGTAATKPRTISVLKARIVQSAKEEVVRHMLFVSA